MNTDLEIYKKHFDLDSAIFTRIDHKDTIISEVYKVVTIHQTPFILKIFPSKGDFFREIYFLQKLKDNIPIPQLLDIMEPSSNHFGAILMQYLEGELLNDKDWTIDLAQEIGTNLARIHSHRAKFFGDATKPKSFIQKASQGFNKKFLEELEECKKHFPLDFFEKCCIYLNNHQHLLANVDGPCIAHRDFRPGNILINNNKLQGIIDWSGTRFGFAEEDFCIIEHYKFAPNSKYKQAFLHGYSCIRPLPKYDKIMLLLRLRKSLGVVGYTIKSNTWNNSNASLYTYHRKFLDAFDFSKL